MLSNEAVDAIVTVAAIREYSKTLNALWVSGNGTQDMVAVLKGKIASLRSGVEEDNDAEIAESNESALNRQHGMPILNVTDDGLESLGFVNRTPKKNQQPDQEDEE